MDKIYSKPHLFFWISIPFIIGLGIHGMDGSLGVNINDTNFVITNWQLSVFIALGFAVIGLVYQALIRSGLLPIRWMTLVHMICSIDVLIILWLILTFEWFSPNSGVLEDYPSAQLLAVLICLAIIVVGQIIFIFNLLLTLSRKKKANTESQNQNIL